MNIFRKFRSVTIIVALFLFVVPQNIPQAQQSSNVDINLVLAIDCSYSVNVQEYALQMAGMAAAFINPQIVKAIESGPYGAIGVTVVQWSHRDSQIIVVPWTRISNAQEALSLAAMIARTNRQTSKGATSISAMLSFAQRLLDASPYQATRKVIDVVADGENNDGERVELVRDRVIARGTTINSLAILNEVSYLFHYMRNRVIGGNYAFVEQAASYEDFTRAIHRKMLREIQSIPVS